MPSFSEISAPQLMRLIGTPDAPVVLDVRIPEDLSADPHGLPGSCLVPHNAFAAQQDAARDAQVVVVCRKGKKLSHGVAARLRHAGHAAEVLEGGTLGWHSAGLPRVPLSALPGHRPTRWVTRHRPKIDRIACPWLIRRFLDPDAEILFVPPAEVAEVAARFDAIPFDAPGAALDHRAALCTFDAMIADFGLGHPALDRMATVVRAADTDTHAAAPQAAGLLAISVGLSRMYRDDTAQLNTGMVLYDALYRWARDGFEEGHNA